MSPKFKPAEPAAIRDDPDNTALSDNHRRAFNAVVTLTEKRLLELESILTKYERFGSLIIDLKNDLNGADRQRMVGLIGKIRTMLVEFSSRFSLPGDSRSLRRELYTAAGFLWEDLASAADHKFKGYGKLDPAVLDDVEKALEGMIGKVREIMTVTN